MKLATFAAAGLLVLAACGSATSTTGSRTVTPPTASTAPSTTPASTTPASTPPTPPSSTPAAACDQALWVHVYHAYRLQVISSCKTVTGTVEEIRQEPDGDLHILLKPDPAYAGLVNQANIADQHGDLVLEEICVGTVTQSDAVAACQNFTPPAEPALSPGDHVQVTGSYVLDGVHGWTEIHPVSQISVGP